MAVTNNLTIYKGEAVTFYFGLTPSTLTTQGVALSASTLPVASTDGFPVSGTAYVLVGATVTTITYTGKTESSLTGCANVPAAPQSGALVTSGLDISGYTMVMTVRANATDAATLLTVSVTRLTPNAAGMFSAALTSSQTKTTLGVGDFAYDVQRTDAGSEAVLSIGDLQVLQEVLYP